MGFDDNRTSANFPIRQQFGFVDFQLTDSLNSCTKKHGKVRLGKIGIIFINYWMIILLLIIDN